MIAQAKPKAYSYIRFSTPEQLTGDSLRRQLALSRQYAQTHDLDLDESLTYKDLGVSAFTGSHAREGALSDFLAAIDDGHIPSGSYLLVESLDRLSRENVLQAFKQFSSILEAGVTIVTLADNQKYTEESISKNFGDLFISLGSMLRAHEESAIKAARLSAAWGRKRELARESGKPITAQSPAWLELAEGKFEVVEERAGVVQRIFDMVLAGFGKTHITKTFNREGIPTFGRAKAWHTSYIQKILENEAVIGTFQPMTARRIGGKKVREPGGEPIDNYYPAIISRETYLKARDIRKSRAIPGGPKGKKLSNLFTGLAYCSHCGSSMHFVNKGNGDRYLVCSSARSGSGDCAYYSWRYIPVEPFIIMSLSQLDFTDLQPTIKQRSKERIRELEAA